MISRYKGELTQKGILDGMIVISNAFPSLPLEFYDILTDRLHANSFCDDRFNDAIVHVIDTCHYPTPTIADFISYDKRIPCFNNVINGKTEIR